MLRKTAISRAINRPILIAGAERKLAFLIGLASFGLIFIGVAWVTTILAIFIWILGMAAVRHMAKIDPQLSDIYMRSLKYKAYYPPKGRVSHK